MYSHAKFSGGLVEVCYQPKEGSLTETIYFDPAKVDAWSPTTIRYGTLDGEHRVCELVIKPSRWKLRLRHHDADFVTEAINKAREPVPWVAVRPEGSEVIG